MTLLAAALAGTQAHAVTIKNAPGKYGAFLFHGLTMSQDLFG